MLATGGGDAVVNLWYDSTAADKEEAFCKEEEGVLKGQELETAVSDADYAKAIRVAFELGRPHKHFDIFSDLCRKKHAEDQVPRKIGLKTVLVPKSLGPLYPEIGLKTVLVPKSLGPLYPEKSVGPYSLDSCLFPLVGTQRSANGSDPDKSVEAQVSLRMDSGHPNTGRHKSGPTLGKNKKNLKKSLLSTTLLAQQAKPQDHEMPVFRIPGEQ